MACLRDCVRQTREQAYAHHIQRLMVTGNFALLAGVDPVAVNYWYLAVYADAYEWVELPNVQGMALFADGGVLASKPYAASGKYIDRMSNYCGNCRYDVRRQTETEACPFNALYWNFIAANREAFVGNPRMAMPLRTLDRMSPEKVASLRYKARNFLDSLKYAEPGAW
jgi:deoxyribodipyrimidine photolyase-related protein